MVTDNHNESVWNHVTPPECLPNPSILRFASNNSWVPAEEPLHADIDVTKAKVCEVGPGIAFANHLLKRDPAVGVIGLVPCAIGGTTLNEWLPAAKAYYNQMLVRTYGALRASNNGGQIRALLWYQGESEAKGKDYPSPFASNLEIFFNSLRHDFGLPALPIIQVALPSATYGSYVKDIRKFQLELKLPMLSTVDANGLQLQNDSVHLTSTAQVQLGIAMANAFLQISHTTPTDSETTASASYHHVSVNVNNFSTVNDSTGSNEVSISSSGNQVAPPKATNKTKRNLPKMPDPDAKVITLLPKTQLAANRFVYEICNKRFKRYENLQLHIRGHNLSWKLKQRSSKEVKNKAYICLP
nr:probable carbohydrate esterase At4g34215 [Ipomoea batatas]